MKKVRIAIFALMALVGCKSPQMYPYWPEHRIPPSFDIVNDNKELQERDALVMSIDKASNMFPEDIEQTTLIIEILPYEDLRKLYETKYWEVPDSRQARKVYRKYKHHRKQFLKGFITRKVYMDKGSYDALEVDKFRYVLRTTARFTEDTSRAPGSYGFSWHVVEYIYDRKAGALYCELTNPPPYDERNKIGN